MTMLPVTYYMTFKCPHCHKNINIKLIATHFASEGGKAVAAKMTPEQRQARSRKGAQVREKNKLTIKKEN